MDGKNGSMVDFSSQTSEITFDGNTYKVAPLTIGDRAAVERRIRDRRLTHMLERCRGVPLPDEVIGTAIAKIECSTVTLDEALDTSESRSYMLWLSLKRGGSVLTEQQVAGLPPMKAKTLGALVRHITGLETAEGEDEARPTTPTPPNSPASEALIGANS